ncbi:hypothetical protein GCM10020358_80560 [Amorphoplanes nipponensis]
MRPSSSAATPPAAPADPSPAATQPAVTAPAGHRSPAPGGSVAETAAVLDPEPETPASAEPVGPAPRPGAPSPRTGPLPPGRPARPVARPTSGAGAGGDDQSERGLRGLVGSGSSQVSVGAALRARDAARPTAEQLAEAEAELVIVRRNWMPREDLPRNR